MLGFARFLTRPRLTLALRSYCLPSDPQAIFKLASEAHGAGRLTEAERLYTACLRIEPGYLEASYNHAIALKELGRHARAEKLFRNVIAQAQTERPEWEARVWKALAQTQHEAGKATAAKRSYERVLELDPTDLDVYENLADLFVAQGRPHAADPLLRNAVKHMPDSARAWTALGECLLDANTDAALAEGAQCLERAISIDPKAYRAHMGLGICESHWGNRQEALAHLLRAVRLAPESAEVRLNLGAVLDELGRHKDGLRQVQRALQLAPQYAEAHYVRGVMAHKQGDLPTALRSYSRTVALSPLHAQAYTNLGLVYQERGQVVRAIGFYKKALELEPLRAHGHVVLGQALQQLHRPEEAESCYKQALSCDADDWSAHLNLAALYYETGRPTEAERHRARSIELQPESKEFFEQLDAGKLKDAQPRQVKDEEMEDQSYDDPDESKEEVSADSEVDVDASVKKIATEEDDLLSGDPDEDIAEDLAALDRKPQTPKVTVVQKDRK